MLADQSVLDVCNCKEEKAIFWDVDRDSVGGNALDFGVRPWQGAVGVEKLLQLLSIHSPSNGPSMRGPLCATIYAHGPSFITFDHVTVISVRPIQSTHRAVPKLISHMP